MPQALGIVGVLKGHDPQVQPVAVAQDTVGFVHALVQQGVFYLRGQGKGVVVLPLAEIGPLRGVEVVQHRQRSRRPQPLPGGQPQPVFQLRHNFIPFPNQCGITFTNLSIRGMVIDGRGEVL